MAETPEEEEKRLLEEARRKTENDPVPDNVIKDAEDAFKKRKNP